MCRIFDKIVQHVMHDEKGRQPIPFNGVVRSCKIVFMVRKPVLLGCAAVHKIFPGAQVPHASNILFIPRSEKGENKSQNRYSTYKGTFYQATLTMRFFRELCQNIRLNNMNHMALILRKNIGGQSSRARLVFAHWRKKGAEIYSKIILFH